MSDREQILLTEEFKGRVFAKLKAGDARGAQELCFDFVKENEIHAKQVYKHLLGIARKKGWVAQKGKSGSGIRKAKSTSGSREAVPGLLEITPIEVTPVEVTPVEVTPVHVVQVTPLQDSGALAVPPGLLGDPGGALPVPAGFLGGGDTGAALPVPPGLLGSSETAYAPPPGYGEQPFPGSGGYPAHDPQQQQPFSPPGGYPAQQPFPGSGGYPAHDPQQQPFSPPGGYPTAQQPFSPAGGYPVSPSVRLPAPGDEPQERGFLARVSAEGRAARVRLLLQAGQTPPARALAETTRSQAPFSAHAHAAVGAVAFAAGDLNQALQAYTQAVRTDPQDRLAVRGYAQVLRALGRPRDAAEALKRIVSPTEGTLTDLYALGGALRQAGDTTGADRVRQVASSREVQGLEPLHQQVPQLLAQGNAPAAAQALLELLEHLEPPYRSAVDLATQIMQRGPGLELAQACAEVYLRAEQPWLAVRALHKLGVGGLAPHARPVLARAYLALGAGDLAREQLELASQAGVARAEDFVALGEVYLDRGHPDDSARAFARALEAEAQRAQVHHRLAQALALAGDLDGAVRALEQAQRLGGEAEGESQDALDRITEQANLGRIRAARTRLAADRADHEAHLELAEALVGNGEVEEALAHLEHALEAPDMRARVREVSHRLAGHGDRELLLFVSALATEDGDGQAAVQALEELAQDARGDVELQLAYCRALSAANRWQAACDRLRETLSVASAYELEPTLACARALLEQGLDRGLVLACALAWRRLKAYPDAEGWLARYAQAHPQDLEVASLRADLHEAQGQFAQALEVFQPLVAGPGAPTEAVERAGLLALAAGRPEEAKSYLRRAHELAPSDPVAFGAAERAERLWRGQEAARLAQTADPAQRRALATLHATNGEHTQALAALAPELGSPPERGYYAFACEHLASQPEVAESVIRWVAQRTNQARGAASYHEALYRAAQLYEAQDDAESARRLYLEVHLGDPSFKDTAARLDTLSQAERPRPSPLTSGRLPEGPPRSVFEVVREHNLELR
ncbi:MAG: tetratricopeptide repeat protein [Planctomycetota bacterium]